MTAFVRLSNKKHLQHASRHAELHFSDGLCIMAHSPKAFLLTFHLLVRKSHYQHKMNFLKLEGSSSKTPVAKPDGTKMFCSAFLNDARMCCFFANTIVKY